MFSKTISLIGKVGKLIPTKLNGNARPFSVLKNNLNESGRDKLNVAGEKKFFIRHQLAYLSCISYEKSTDHNNLGIIRRNVLNYNLSNDFVILPRRSITKFSYHKGKKRTDKDVIKRFKRLNWGIWIRPIAGADRQLWRKSYKRINRIKQNVFCSLSQSRKLDIMVSKFWRKPKVYADDPYKEYSSRENFWFYRRKGKDDFF